MATIKDIHLPFRDDWVPASFRNAQFFINVTNRENGRRIITHEFPKKEQPYSEDMGRRAKSFTIRAYCITSPVTLDGDNANLYNVDYRVVRDALLSALETIGPGTLILNTLPSENVVVTRYRLTEEERFGGYCVFDIEFAEYGLPPQYLTPTQNTATVLNNSADTLRNQTSRGMAGDNPPPENPTFNDRFGSWPQMNLVR
jgi:prophage DNA circulation protein